jgi:hypothetical protein
MASLAPVPSDGATCANCSATLVADQRYCLSCGHPVSPVRLAFLDVLAAERSPQPSAGQLASPLAYASPQPESPVGPAWLRRYTPLFGVAAVLLVAMLIGLLLGHWVSQSKSPGSQVIKVEGLGAGLAPASGTSTTAATTATGAGAAKSSAATSKEEKEELAEAKAEETKPAAPPKPVEVKSSTLSKLTNSTGRKHQEEINKLGTAPIAVP